MIYWGFLEFGVSVHMISGPPRIVSSALAQSVGAVFLFLTSFILISKFKTRHDKIVVGGARSKLRKRGVVCFS